jgi:oxygen-independent coproporphyrinogen-3 oxidase
MSTPTLFDADLLRRYDRPGPRYTSYPTAPHFTSAFGMQDLLHHIAAGNAAKTPLSLYVHVPFCLNPCFYCGCNRVITRDLSRGEQYLERLLKEVDLMGALIDRDREVIQLHLGGGTPNFLPPASIGRLVERLGQRFRFSSAANRDFSIEIDPRSVNPDDMARLAEIGFNRASFGVQDFDPVVQEAVNRIQSVEETLAVMEAARAAGFGSLNIDLIYGLPKQNHDGFARTLDTVIAARPDRLAIYSYAHLPHMFKPQKRINAADLPTPDEKLGLLALAIEKLNAAGYVNIGMDHFALPGDEMARAQEAGHLHRNFMGYTIHAKSDLVGFGASSISHIGDSFSQNQRAIGDYLDAIDAGRSPLHRGMSLSADDVLRAEVIQQVMCQGEIDIPALERDFGIEFAHYFAEDLRRLAPLAADGLVEIGERRIRATPRGRMLLRHVAMAFDVYLPANLPPGAARPGAEDEARPVRFSSTI